MFVRLSLSGGRTARELFDGGRRAMTGAGDDLRNRSVPRGFLFAVLATKLHPIHGLDCSNTAKSRGRAAARFLLQCCECRRRHVSSDSSSTNRRAGLYGSSPFVRAADAPFRFG